jgi:type III secretory pathway component EscR
MLTILLCVLLAIYVISSSIVLYYEWRVYEEIPLGKTLIKVALLVVAIISFPVVSNFDEELEKNSAEITRVTVTNTETNETLFSVEGNLSVHTSKNSTSTCEVTPKS